MRAVGTLVERLKRGESISNRAGNPYIQEALEFEGLLYSPQEALEGGLARMFAERQGRPTFLEIGCYFGKNLIEMAQANPDSNFVGLDITYKRAVKTARKIRNLALPNAKVAICEGRQFLQSLPQGTLNGVCLFFPDPWAKKGQAKNRIVNPEFIATLQKILTPGGFFWFKTDAQAYAEVGLELARAAGWEISDFDAVPPELGGLDYFTVFEALFQRQNLPAYRRVYRTRR